jgi:transcriptional regulator with XRE-family HTH domain
MKPDPYIQRVIEKLHNRPLKLSLRQIARDTGLTVQWISLFARGQIREPSYTRIVKLDNYLSQ